MAMGSTGEDVLAIIRVAVRAVHGAGDNGGAAYIIKIEGRQLTDVLHVWSWTKEQALREAIQHWRRGRAERLKE